ncbi:MAG: peptide deformylase [Clostridia bacterium]|nr:peptide deformylase [Clostridia bacterium]
MSLRDIVKDKNPILRTKCRKVEIFDAKLEKILDDMRDTLFRAEGAGLAAPQIGLAKRIAIVNADGVYLELVNPVITEYSGSQIGQEACLSVDGKSCIVERPNRVVVEYFNRHGKACSYEAKGFVARACCHEIDHLDGILFYDKEYRNVYRRADR